VQESKKCAPDPVVPTEKGEGPNGKLLKGRSLRKRRSPKPLDVRFRPREATSLGGGRKVYKESKNVAKREKSTRGKVGEKS